MPEINFEGVLNVLVLSSMIWTFITIVSNPWFEDRNRTRWAVRSAAITLTLWVLLVAFF